MLLPARRSTRLRWSWIGLLPLLCCISCSRDLALNPVQGKVLYKSEPLKGVLVTLHPKQGADMHTVLPTGLTDEDGTFSVSTGAIEGAPEGDYILTMICSVESTRKPQGMAMRPELEDRFQGKYADRAASKFFVKVEPGRNQLEVLDLK